MSVIEFLAWLALTLAALGLASVVAGWLLAECLDERDRRRAERVGQ